MPRRSALSGLLALLRNPRIYMALGLVLGSLFVYLTVRGIDWAEVRAQLASTSPMMLLASLALTLVSAFVRAVRWRALFVKTRVSVLRLFSVEMAALGLNNISPVRLLDEPAILTMLTLRDRMPAPTVIATLLMSRVQDIAFSLCFIAATLVLEPAVAERAGMAAPVSLILVGALILLLNLGRIARRVGPIGRIPGIFAYSAAVDDVTRNKRRLLATSSLTFYPLLLGPATWALAHGMGVEINLFQATIVAIAAVLFSTSVPGLPGAFGAFELAVQEILSLWGIPRELGFGFGFVLHLTFFLPPIAFGVIVLPREGIGIMQNWRRLAGADAGKPPRVRNIEQG